jgi:hypothetical protein
MKDTAARQRRQGFRDEYLQLGVTPVNDRGVFHGHRHQDDPRRRDDERDFHAQSD